MSHDNFYVLLTKSIRVRLQGHISWLLHLFARARTAIFTRLRASARSSSDLARSPVPPSASPARSPTNPTARSRRRRLGQRRRRFRWRQDHYSVSLIAGQTYFFSLRGTGATPINDAFLAPGQSCLHRVRRGDDDGGNDLEFLVYLHRARNGGLSASAQSFANPGDPASAAIRSTSGSRALDAVGDTTPRPSRSASAPTFGFREAARAARRPLPCSPAISTVIRSTSSPGNIYTFKLAGGADYATNPSAVPTGELDTFLILRDAAGNILASNDDNSFPGDISSGSASSRDQRHLSTSTRPLMRARPAAMRSTFDTGRPRRRSTRSTRSTGSTPTTCRSSMSAACRTAYVYFGAGRRELRRDRRRRRQGRWPPSAGSSMKSPR